MTSVNSETNLSQIHIALARADQDINSVLIGESHELDLVALRESLAEAQSVIAQVVASQESHQRELSLLRRDIEGRILAMTRATNVAQDKSAPGKESDLSDELPRASAAELLQLYRRACVRFRDTFPGNTRYSSGDSPALKDWSEFRS